MFKIKNKNILDRFCTKFCKIVEKHCKYIVVSGFVAISSGRARGTEDIDLIIEKINENKFEELHNDLKKNGFECMQTSNYKEIYTNYLKEGNAVRYIEKDKFIPQIEFKMAKDSLDAYQIKTRIKLPKTGLEVWFSSINMNLAFKEHNLGSKKDFEDARHLRIMYPELVDEKEIKKIKEMLKKYRSLINEKEYQKMRKLYPKP